MTQRRPELLQQKSSVVGLGRPMSYDNCCGGKNCESYPNRLPGQHSP